ncbi:MAG: hypothetical protein P4L87_15620 [Formivibrio sp.]|nr:hypothetical protein [Formivibrio sp.]
MIFFHEIKRYKFHERFNFSGMPYMNKHEEISALPMLIFSPATASSWSVASVAASAISPNIQPGLSGFTADNNLQKSKEEPQ